MGDQCWLTPKSSGDALLALMNSQVFMSSLSSSQWSSSVFDVAIVGGSFAGLAAAMPLVRGHRKVVVIDAGLPRNRFAAHAHGIFGMDGLSPAMIRERALQELQAYPTFRQVEGRVVSITGEDGRFCLATEAGSGMQAQKLILATGIRDELPELAGLAERWVKTVIHCPYCHGYELSHRALGVLGSSAMSWHQAAMIPDWGATTFFTQGNIQLEPEQRDLLVRRGVMIEDSPVVTLLGEAPELTGVRLADGREIAIEGLYVASRINAAEPLALSLGCKLEESPMGTVLGVDAMKQTSVPGVFAAGDLSNLMQNGTFAIASGTLAGVSAHRSLMFG
ncbi:NAD(P)/FAD-dependent oxidoreductase [Pokkaliibacter sp. CJK22405]|uniref:NAD(P)/FAD-dependent oxidoreductase n=1 Tax=Pokkaliibacter sp. CJK22405 TaxID=3384615 RepID=UPI0039849F48